MDIHLFNVQYVNIIHIHIKGWVVYDVMRLLGFIF